MQNAITAWQASQPTFNRQALQAWYIDQYPAGWLSAELVAQISAAQLLIDVAGRWQSNPSLADAPQRSAAWQQFAVSLHQAGQIHGWRHENYDWLDHAGQVQLSIERAAFRTFGLRSRAVHINGYRADGQLWLGRRALSKAVDPGRLDNLAAGGIASGETPWQTVVRELAEEAGVPPNIAQRATAKTVVHSLRNEPDGVHDELLYCYDLLLPDDFVPRNTDGEVAGFTLVTPHQAAAQLRDMTWDAAAVTVDWLNRHIAATS